MEGRNFGQAQQRSNFFRKHIDPGTQLQTGRTVPPITGCSYCPFFHIVPFSREQKQGCNSLWLDFDGAPLTAARVFFGKARGTSFLEQCYFDGETLYFTRKSSCCSVSIAGILQRVCCARSPSSQPPLRKTGVRFTFEPAYIIAAAAALLLLYLHTSTASDCSCNKRVQARLIRFVFLPSEHGGRWVLTCSRRPLDVLSNVSDCCLPTETHDSALFPV